MSEIDERALIAHEERHFRRRRDEIDAGAIRPRHGRRYEPTVEQRLEWARADLERFDYPLVIARAKQILELGPTDEQRKEAESLRRLAEHMYAKFGDTVAQPRPVEPTWR